MAPDGRIEPLNKTEASQEYASVGDKYYSTSFIWPMTLVCACIIPSLVSVAPSSCVITLFVQSLCISSAI